MLFLPKTVTMTTLDMAKAAKIAADLDSCKPKSTQKIIHGRKVKNTILAPL